MNLTPTVHSFGTTIIMDHWDPEYLLSLIQDYRITWLFIIATMVIDILAVRNIERYDLASLRILATGGAPFHTDVWKKAEKIFKDTSVSHGYGLTECSVPLMNLPFFRSLWFCWKTYPWSRVKDSKSDNRRRCERRGTWRTHSSRQPSLTRLLEFT